MRTRRPGVSQVFLVLLFTSRCGLGQGTFVIITRIGGVATEDSYCHQGINKVKKKEEEEGGLNNANTATEIKGCELILARLDQ